MKKRSLALDDVFAEHGAEPWPVTPRSRCFKGGGGGGQQTSTTVQNNDPWSGQQDYLKFGFQQAQDNYNSNKPEYFQGNTIAGFNPYQTAAQGMTVNRALSGSPVLQAGQNQAQATLRGDYLTPGNPYISGLTQSLDAQIRPMVDAKFTGSNRSFSPAHAGAYTSAMTNALAPQLFGSYEAERGRMNNMVGQTPGLAQADYADIGALNTVGQTQQEQSQNEINAAIEKHNFEQNAQANKLANYMQLIGNNYGSTNTSTTTGPAPGKGGALSNVANLAGAGANAGIAYKMFSDARLKTDIRHIGELPSGIPVYKFRYTWGGPERIGVMAQEVEKIIPEAVTDWDGVKMVDYGRLH